uniref:Zinc finger protein 568 n=1 Tax=Lygus hesperus TaxID=30085 RepID=A0A146L4C6_LYGHE
MASDMEVITVLPPPMFNYDADDLLGEWEQWFQKLEDYLIAYDRVDTPDEDKIRVLLNHLGNEGKEIYESLEAKNSPGERITSYEELCEALARYFDSAKNVLFERFKFFKMKRKSSQSVKEFVDDLTKASSSCEFTEKENIIRDKLMEQLKDKLLIERLLVEGGTLTLERAVKICHRWENRKANENKPPGSENGPEPPRPPMENLSAKIRDSNTNKNLSSLPVITILGVIPQEGLNNSSLKAAEPSDDDRDFWDDGNSRTYSDEEENKPKGPQGSMCDVCGKICQGPAHLRKHMEVHSGKKPYKCTKCDYRGTLKASLQSHMRVHESCKFKCDQCDFKARRSYGLKIHKRVNHTGERPYACEICDRKYPDCGALNFHMRSRHTEDKIKQDQPHWNYKCDTCGRKFVMEDRYNRHVAAHASDQPYQCYSCDFKTNSRNSIIRHLSNRHGEKNFVCIHCDYRTAMKSDFSDHMLRHSGTRPYMCDVCGFSAASRSTLTSHKRVHSEKNITCEYCDFRTSRRQSMKGHMRRHTGDRPYECTFCGYKAAQKGTLTKHIEVIHNKNGSSKKPRAPRKTPAKQTASNVDSGQSAVTSQNTSSQEVYPPLNQQSVNTNYSQHHLQHHNYNPHVLPPAPAVYLPQNNYYPSAPSAYYNNNANLEIVHNNSPFDLDQFVRSNMIN